MPEGALIAALSSLPALTSCSPIAVLTSYWPTAVPLPLRECLLLPLTLRDRDLLLHLPLQNRGAPT